MDAETITPQDAAEALGLDVFDLSGMLRQDASTRLRALADSIEYGHTRADGDVTREHYDEVFEGVWRLVDSAKNCDIVWQAEGADEEA